MDQSQPPHTSLSIFEHIFKNTNTKLAMDCAMEETQLNLLDDGSLSNLVDANTALAQEHDAIHSEITLFLEHLRNKLSLIQVHQPNPFSFEEYHIVENVGRHNSDATLPDFEIILLTNNHSPPSSILNLLENVLKENSSHFGIDPSLVNRSGNECPLEFKFNNGFNAIICVAQAGTSFYDDVPVRNEEEVV